MGLHLFIDNSNIFIEARRVAQLVYNCDDRAMDRLRIDFGRLMEFTRKGRELREAILVGSEPPPNDSLWQRLRQLGIQLRIFQRSPFTGREREVDQELINCIRDTLEANPQRGVIALVSGDRGYAGTLERCLARGWEVEIYFWRQASTELKRLAEREPGQPRAQFVNLNPHFNRITFREAGRS